MHMHDIEDSLAALSGVIVWEPYLVKGNLWHCIEKYKVGWAQETEDLVEVALAKTINNMVCNIGWPVVQILEYQGFFFSSAHFLFPSYKF